MDNCLEEGFGFATLGSICILIATLIVDKLGIAGIKETAGGFILAGFMFIFGVSSMFLGYTMNWENLRDRLSLWSILVGIVTLFISSLVLVINYARYYFSL